MNKEYTYIDGKVIVSDENGNKVPMEYYDNLDEVLIQENLIETIEDKISYLENESNSYKKNNKKHYIPFVLPMSILILVFGVPALYSGLNNTNAYVSTINTIFGSMNEAVFSIGLCSITVLPLVSLFELDGYKKHRERLKEEKGVNSELDFLKEQLIKEKEHLIKLQNDKKRDNENKEFRVVEVNDLERLRNFRSHMNLFYDLGYNGEKYYKYLQEGKLETKLSKHYTELGIGVAKEYLEEKGPTLVKKIKPNNK